MTLTKNIFLGLIVIILLALGAFYSTQSKKEVVVVPNTEPVVCTADVMMCLDGTYVSRTPPACIFYSCPVTMNIQAWTAKIDTAGKVGFKYPESIGKNFIQIASWPPTGLVSAEKFSCVKTGTVGGDTRETKLVKINDKNYCVTAEQERNYDYSFINYTYSREVEQKTVSLKFRLKYLNCQNYEEEAVATLCKAERSGFNLDNLVDNIFGTLKIVQ